MIIDHNTLLIILACGFGLMMTWGVGANDLSNVMSTAMGSKSITIRQAIVIAIIFEFAGAFFAGDHVTETLRSGIIDISQIESNTIMVHGMLAVLAAGTTWMFFASYFGLPVSITHTIVGSIVGFGAIQLGFGAMHWHTVELIAMSWLLSPLLSGIVAFAIFRSLQYFIFIHLQPVDKARRILPFYLFSIGFILSSLTVFRGITNFGLQPNLWQSMVIASLMGLVILLLGQWVISSLKFTPGDQKLSSRFVMVEQIFGVLMLFTACAMVFAHGSNDVANAVGPMAVILTLIKSPDSQTQMTSLPLWIVAFGCFGILVGFLTFGRRVIETVGSGITALTPSRAFSATFSAAVTVVCATSAGIPVSATQTLVGGILGVGLARGIGALNMNVIRSIFMSWMITIPVGASLTVVYYYVFHWLLG